MKEEIFEIIENIIKQVKIESFEVYDLCEDSEKLKFQDYKNDDVLGYKILKNSILLKYYIMKKSSDYVEIRYIDNDMLNKTKEKFDNVKYKEDELYIRVYLNDYRDIELLRDELCEIFKNMFIQYMNSEESFGCCSRFEECSNNKKCINDNVRMRLSCQYKKNLENGKIFYGVNRNC